MPFGWLGRGRLGAGLGAVRNVRRKLYRISLHCIEFRNVGIRPEVAVGGGRVLCFLKAYFSMM